MSLSHGRKRGSAGDPHGWASLQNYLNVHHAYLDRLRHDVILHDNLAYDFSPPDEFKIHGRILCHHGLFVDVQKTLEINPLGYVRTIWYSYHAGLEGPLDRPIFRYDNAHAYSREGHTDEHHKHRFDPATWQEIEPPEWIGRARWPHLSEVVEELAEWWRTTGQHLNPTVIP